MDRREECRVMNAFQEYIRELRKNIEKGDSTEHTHRPALAALLEA